MPDDLLIADAHGDDPAEAIADAVVAFLSDEQRQFSVQFVAENPEDIAAALYSEDLHGVRVLVSPQEDLEEDSDGKSTYCEYRLIVVVLADISGQSPYRRRMLNQLLHEIRVTLRGEPMGRGNDATGTPRDSATHVRTPLATKFDPEGIDSGKYLGVLPVVYNAVESEGTLSEEALA